MPTNVVMPALGIAQDTGRLIQWLKEEGAAVAKGEPLMEIETDKATVEVESPGTGILANVTAAVGDEVPVGQVIAVILGPGELAPEPPTLHSAPPPSQAMPSGPASEQSPAAEATSRPTPVAARLAAQHGLDLDSVKALGSRITKEDVLAHIQAQAALTGEAEKPRLWPASPKARRLASERGIELAAVQGTGPGGAVLAADVLAVQPARREADLRSLGLSTTWRIMAERTTQSWTSVPHFFLLREACAARLAAWKAQAQKRYAEKITYTDLLVKLVAAALGEHPRLNARWEDGAIVLNSEINVGLAVATEEGLVVPVIHQADQKGLRDIAAHRRELVARAQAGKLRLADLSGGTFTISNLGMYDVDAANAIINPPQAAILAIGRIAPRVVAVRGRPKVRPTLMLSLSCDHRVVDGARAAQFLRALTELIEEPLGLLAP